MAYTKQTWTDNDPNRPLSAARMNVIEQGIADAHTLIPGTGNPTGVPWFIKPANTSTDIGALINASLNTNGVAVVAANPSPGEFWSCTTPIEVGSGEALLGYGMNVSKIRASGTFPTGVPLVTNRAANSAGWKVAGLFLDCNSRATNAIRVYVTDTPSEVNVNPDFCITIEDIHAHNAAEDGVYIGGNGGHPSNARETRVRWLLSTSSGGWGLTIASSDTFISDVTTHGSGPGGIRGLSGQSGNTKLLHCKAYYEPIGIQLQGVRSSIQGGEVQDCGLGVEIAGDGYVNTVIDTCGSTAYPALKVTGSGCTFAVAIVGRNQAGSPGNGKNSAIEFTGSGQVHTGFISTNGLKGGYLALYRNANRAQGSGLTVT